MKCAVISGANGFVGRAVLRELLDNNYLVYAIIRKGREAFLPKVDNCIPVICDLENIKSLANQINIPKGAIFYHFAWAGASGQDRANTQLQLRNVQWTIDTLCVASELCCSRFVVAGSIMEKETIAAAFAQGNRPGLGYIYGSGKVAAHAMAKSKAVSLGIDLIWTYITNAYGAGERSARMVNTTILKCIKKESPKFTAGTQNYDFVYIDDVAKAFRLLGEKGRPYKDYVIGSGSAKPLREFLLEMQAAVAPHIDFSFGDVPFTGVNLSLEDYSTQELEQDVGFHTDVSFSEGCKLTYDWLKESLDSDQNI